MNVRCALLLIVAAMPALAAPREARRFSRDAWIRVSTPHFEVDTTAGEKAGRDTALQFERVRDFFERVSPLKATGEVPVRIILFRTAQQYAQYAMNAVAAAFYVSAPTRDYIVLQDSPQKHAVAIHEYMHLVVRHSGLNIPLWLNEGWADVYSTLRPVSDGVAVGDLLPGRIATLQSAEWMDFETLTSLTQSSEAYNERDRAGIFYAESWALAHMLYLAPDYKDHFRQFVTALNKGASSETACRLVFGKSAAQVYADLRNYLERRKLYGAVFETRLPQGAERPSVEKLSDFDSGLMLADLLSATNRKDAAGSEYERLDKLHPGRPEVAEGLGFLELSRGDRAGARRQFRKAFDEGAGEPSMCIELAEMDRQAGAAPASIVPVLERAVKNGPDNPGVRIQLGLAKLAARDYAGAISTLAAIRRVDPAEATPVYGALTYASIETGDLDAARGYAATALNWATSDTQRAGIAQLNSLIEARSKVHVVKGEMLVRISGTAANVICSPSGNKLEVSSMRGMLTFDMPDARAIEFSRPGGGPAQLACGTHAAQPISIDYVAAPAGSIITGVVRRIDLGGAQ